MHSGFDDKLFLSILFSPTNNLRLASLRVFRSPVKHLCPAAHNNAFSYYIHNMHLQIQLLHHFSLITYLTRYRKLW